MTVEQARDEILAIAKRLEQEYPDTNKDKHATVVPLKDLMVGRQPADVRHAPERVSGRAADRVRQRRQPAAGAVVGARPRDGGPGGGRRQPAGG